MNGAYGPYKSASYEVLGRYPELVNDEQLAAGAEIFQIIQRRQDELNAHLKATTLTPTPKLVAPAEPRIEITSRVEAPKSAPIVRSIDVTRPPTAPPPTEYDGPGELDDEFPI
jgi:hypothetical protein